jgi:hypothetical protein
MTTIQTFYADPHLGSRFGETAGRRNPHRGLDVNRHLTGTPVPSLFDGVVVRSERQIGLGNVVVVRRANGTHIGYAHLASRSVGKGQTVSAGQHVGTLGNTGTLTKGPHTHVTVSKTSNNPALGAVIDPLPYILAARDGLRDPDGVIPPAPPVDVWEFNRPSKAMQLRIQRALKARGRYNGKLDGDWGPLSIKGIQETITRVGYRGQLNGVPNSETCYYVQVYAAKFGGYTGPTDRKLGPKSWLGFAEGLES